MKTKLLSVFLAAAVLTGCGSDPEKATPTADVPPPAPSAKSESGDSGVFGWLGVTGDSSTSSSSGSSSSSGLKPEDRKGVAVNAYLWRATLDTLAFMPLASADPWGGVVNYDWYVNPQAPNERFKATVFILDRRLRADALNVTVTKEVKGADGQWTAAPVAAQTETDLENAILTKARQLNLSNAG